MTRRHLSLTAAFLAALPALPASAAAAIPQVEQINRLSGAQGAFSQLWYGENQTYPSVVSDDGRYATFYVNGPAEAEVTPIPGPGLYFRDIVDNTTTKIAGPNSLLTGLDNTGTKVSFITAEKLDPADTNGIADLYYRDGATGSNVLLSRANGVNGKATGVTSQGTLARGGRYAIFGAPNGTHRRDLQTGITKKVAYSGFLNTFPGLYHSTITPGDYGNYTADQFVSDDGQVAWTGDLFITPKGLQYTPFSIYDGSPTRYPLITRDGEHAVWQEAIPPEEEAPGTPPYSLGAGKIRTWSWRNSTTSDFTPPAALHAIGWFSTLVGIAPDDRTAIYAVYRDNDDRQPRIGASTWNVETGQVKDLGRGGQFSHNLKYGVTNNSTDLTQGPVRAVFATPGNTLPGTVDPPSANAYGFAGRSCWTGRDKLDQPELVGGPFWARPKADPLLPEAESVNFVVKRPSGDVIAEKTYLLEGADVWNPEVDVVAGLGNESFTVDITATLKDGRSTGTERTSFGPEEFGCDAYGWDDYIPIGN